MILPRTSDLIEHASSHRLERSVHSNRRPARIGWSRETFPAIALRIVADDEIAGEQVNLIVDERRRGVFTLDEAQEASTAAALARLVEIVRENLLLDSGRIARRRGPALVEVDAEEFQMRLGHELPVAKIGDIEETHISSRITKVFADASRRILPTSARMSAFTVAIENKADMTCCAANVCFCPKPDMNSFLTARPTIARQERRRYQSLVTRSVRPP